MGFFSTKKEVKLEDFCRDFYENSLLNPKIGEKEMTANTINDWVKFLKKAIVEFDNDTIFINIDETKLTYEFEIMSYELFALAWIHSLGDEFVFDQSVFTNKYLQEKGQDNIWNDMEDYNIAVGSSGTYGLNDVGHYRNMMDKGKFFDKQNEIAQKKGFTLSGTDLAIIRRPMNRKFSEKAWASGSTSFGLTLALLQRLGLIEGDAHKHFGLFGHDNSNINLKINDNARLRLNIFMMGIYLNAKKSFDEIKIIV